MVYTNIKIVITLILIFVVVTLSGCVTGPKTINTPGGKVTVDEGTGPDWCKTGTKITASGQGQQGSFEIKGITTHNGTQVCQAEYTYDQGNVVQYFNEKGDYMIMTYKDKEGKVIQEMNIANPNP
jgi:hypothetical protein